MKKFCAYCGSRNKTAAPDLLGDSELQDRGIVALDSDHYLMLDKSIRPTEVSVIQDLGQERFRMETKQIEQTVQNALSNNDLFKQWIKTKQSSSSELRTLKKLLEHNAIPASKLNVDTQNGVLMGGFGGETLDSLASYEGSDPDIQALKTALMYKSEHPSKLNLSGSAIEFTGENNVIYAADGYLESNEIPKGEKGKESPKKPNTTKRTPESEEEDWVRVLGDKRLNKIKSRGYLYLRTYDLKGKIKLNTSSDIQKYLAVHYDVPGTLNKFLQENKKLIDDNQIFFDNDEGEIILLLIDKSREKSLTRATIDNKKMKTITKVKRRKKDVDGKDDVSGFKLDGKEYVLFLATFGE